MRINGRKYTGDFQPTSEYERDPIRESAHGPTKHTVDLMGVEDYVDPLPQEGSGLGRQVSGDHYEMPIQHSEFCERNEIPYLDSNAIKYIVRHRNKNGMEDLRKAAHYLEIIAELVYGEEL